MSAPPHDHRPAAGLFTDAEDRIVRLPEVVRLTGLSRTTIYRLMKGGSFPSALVLGGNSIGWRMSEVNDWISRRPRSDTP